jgi:hypothetical protein
MRYSQDVGEDKGMATYPETETSKALVESAKAKPEKDRTDAEKKIAECSVATATIEGELR